MSLRCLFDCHGDELVYAQRATTETPAVPARWRCYRCGREKPVGLDNSDRKVDVLFSGHLTAAEVKRIRRKRNQSPVYVTPQVEAELVASAAAAQARRKRGPADVVQMQPRKAAGG